MTRRQKDPLRLLTPHEHVVLTRLSRSTTAPASLVARAKALLAVAAHQSYTMAAHLAGRRSGDAVSQLIGRFNQQGLAALQLRHRGGPRVVYDRPARERILHEALRPPDREIDGTATWSLTTLQRALRRAPDGLPRVSTYTIWRVLRETGWSWQRSRTWCPTGTAQRLRKAGVVTVSDPEASGKKDLIEQAYQQGEGTGVAVWCTDQAGPFQTSAYAGQSWQPIGQPVRQSHEYQRNGTAKLLTLLHPLDGQVRVKGIRHCTNVVLHEWLQTELTAIIDGLPAPPSATPTAQLAHWERWQEGLQIRPGLSLDLPPLRVLLILDNLQGHKTPEFVCWCARHGVLPLYTPLSGSWLNMAESIQRILKQRALAGQHPQTPEEIMGWLEAAARGWNADPTPFEWGGKRAARRRRSRVRQHAQGGSGAHTHQPIHRRASPQWRRW
jgi:transposase